MAIFSIAYAITNKNEGGYAHVKGDNGGETYCGIARKYWGNWKGWAIIDAYKKKHGALKPNQIIKDPELDRLKLEFYKTNFWDVIGGDAIEDQRSANILYDFGVNSGQSRSIKNIERVLNLPETGKISAKLIEAINNPLNHLSL